jgi:hypothetical protein
MFVQLARHVRVYITQKQIAFVKKYMESFPILQTKLDVDDLEEARVLSAKGILVRKKLTNDTLYNLNKHIKFIHDRK